LSSETRRQLPHKLRTLRRRTKNYFQDRPRNEAVAAPEDLRHPFEFGPQLLPLGEWRAFFGGRADAFKEKSRRHL
jgi:hypothetical protein